jgi:hypothetical protein
MVSLTYLQDHVSHRKMPFTYYFLLRTNLKVFNVSLQINELQISQYQNYVPFILNIF